MPDIDLRLGDHARVFVTLAFDEFTGKYPRPGIDRTSLMDMKVSSSSEAICTIRIPDGTSLLGAKKSCSELDAFWMTMRE